MICQNRNNIMTIFKIIFSLLKCYNNKQEFLILRFVFDFSETYFFLNKKQSNIIAFDLRRLQTL